MKLNKIYKKNLGTGIVQTKNTRTLKLDLQESNKFDQVSLDFNLT